MQTPGPGTYRVIHPCVYKNRGPLYSMTGRNMLPSDSTKKPGPGAHSPEKVSLIHLSFDQLLATGDYLNLNYDFLTCFR